MSAGHRQTKTPFAADNGAAGDPLRDADTAFGRLLRQFLDSKKAVAGAGDAARDDLRHERLARHHRIAGQEIRKFLARLG